MSGKATLVLGLALLAAALAPPARALSDAAKKSYVEGVRAIDDQEYEFAARKLREAIKDDAKEGVAKFRGTGVAYEDYFPHLYLGLALEKLGRAAEAQRELEDSQRQGFSAKRGGPNKLLAAALSRVQAVAAAVAQVRPTATPAPPPEVSTPTPRPLPTAGPPTPSPARPAPTPRASASPAPHPVSSPTPAPTMIRIPPPEPTGAPPSGELLVELRAGIRAYFRGDYAQAARLLEKRRAQSATARLFYAYALAGKCLLEGPARDEKLLSRARDEYRAARQAGAPVREDRLISKSVRTILEEG